MKNVVFNMNELSTFELDKLNNDLFYSSMVNSGCSYENLKESGWLNHDYSMKDMLKVMNSMVSPLPHYQDKHKKEINIILSTGSYAPAHEGHINMLKMTKDYLIKNKLIENAVMILSPSHDKYVLNKSTDIVNWNIDNRIKKLYQVIDNYSEKSKKDTILVDIWEAVYCDFPVNFTDVIIKYAKDLEKQNIKYRIFYVFGSDNEKFMNAFKNIEKKYNDKFYGVCVERDSYPFSFQSISKNTLFIKKEKKYSYLQSRQLRKENNYYLVKESKNAKKGFYAIRKDCLLPLQKWINKYPEKKEILISSYEIFHEELKTLIGKYTSMPMMTINIDIQKKILKKLCKNKKSLNLDLETNGFKIKDQYPLNMGRLFNPGDCQRNPLKIVSRPDIKTTKINIKGNFIFVDDDIVSGETYKMVKNKLIKKGINLVGKINLAKEYCEYQGENYELYDIVDTKDFLLGSCYGGLICKFFNKSVRVPYFSNYVNLNTRASIPYSKIKDFNKEVIILNKKFFAKNNYLKVKDMNKNLKNTISLKKVISMNYLIEDETTLEELIHNF